MMDTQRSLSRRTVLARLGAGGISAAVATAGLENSTRANAAVQQGGEPLARQDVSLDQAQTAIDAALAEAEVIGVRMNIAVVDAGTNLTAFARMDGAWLGSIDIAIKKPSRRHAQRPSSRCQAVLSARWCSRGSRSTERRSPTRGSSPSRVEYP